MCSVKQEGGMSGKNLHYRQAEWNSTDCLAQFHVEQEGNNFYVQRLKQ